MSCLVTIVVPVYNEEVILARNVEYLIDFLSRHFSGSYEIVVADNGSTDSTQEVAQELRRRHSCVTVQFSREKGRGLALKRAWLGSNAHIVSYMDADLSTNLQAFPELIAALTSSAYDLAIGSRHQKSSRIRRSFKRNAISRTYNLMIKALFGVGFSDAQCGFKAITSSAARAILPAIHDPRWFMDTELLVIAERCGYRIKEIPVDWTEVSDSRVQLLTTITQNLYALAKLRLTLAHKFPFRPAA